MKAQIIDAMRDGYVTREQLRELLDCNDEQARSFVRDLRLQGLPIVSTCRRQGYHIVETDEEVTIAKEAYAELVAKAIGIMEAAKPLRLFIKEKGVNPKELLPFPTIDE